MARKLQEAIPVDTKKLYDKMVKGDKRCPIKIGDRVMKCNSKEGDEHTDGEVGTIMGNIYVPENEIHKEGYLVVFDGESDAARFVRGDRVKKIN